MDLLHNKKFFDDLMTIVICALVILLPVVIVSSAKYYSTYTYEAYDFALAMALLFVGLELLFFPIYFYHQHLCTSNP